MARQSGIGKTGLDRISQEIDAWKNRDPITGPWAQQVKDTSGNNNWWDTATLEQLCQHVGIDPRVEFGYIQPVLSGDHLSSRVDSMEFVPHANAIDVLRDIAAGIISVQQLDHRITGDIQVGWTNGKRPWEYRDRTLAEYRDFRDSPSKGQYLNSHFQNNHGPA